MVAAKKQAPQLRGSKVSSVPPAILRKVQSDGWLNILTGIGTAKDKIAFSEVSWTPTGRQRAQAMFSGDDLGGKIAQIIPFDGIRRGLIWDIPIAREDENMIPWLDDEFERVHVWDRFYWAWTLARVFGGALAVLSVDDGQQLDKPLDVTKLKRLNAINVFDRWQWQILDTDLIADPSSEFFGQPEYYTYVGNNVTVRNVESRSGAASRVAINSRGDFTGGAGLRTNMFKVHRSRVIRFDGQHLTDDQWKNNQYWHDSIYGRLWEPLRAYTMVHNSVASMLQELNQPVFKIQGLAMALAQDEDQLVMKKLQQVNLSRSVCRAVVIDSEDSFENVDAQTSGIDTLVQKAIDRLTAASNIPHTRMMGESPKGLSGTGKSELTDYYDFVAAQQKIYLLNPIKTVTRLIFNQQTGKYKKEPEKWGFKFTPLELPTEKEIKETQKMQADIDEIYMRNGVLDSFEVAKSRYGSGEYSYETHLDDDIRDEMGRTVPPEIEDPKEETVTEA